MAEMTKRKRAFSLVELVVTVSILSSLAAVVVPEVSRQVVNSRIDCIEGELTAIKKAVCALHGDMRTFPANAAPGNDPGLQSNATVPFDRCAAWHGPYIDRWPRRHPWGGTYDYEFSRNDLFDYDGVRGNEVFLSVKGGLDRNILDRIDADIDDGIPYSGHVRHDGSARLWFYIGEGSCWNALAQR